MTTQHTGQHPPLARPENSDDQGTNFDLKITYRNAAISAIGSAHCITGITRNPELATAYVNSGNVGFGGITFFQVEARIGTTNALDDLAPNCPGNASATGLRLYYDSANRPSGIS